MKFDHEKVKMGLLPYEALKLVAWVMMFGAEKYEPNNWKTLDYRRYIEAAQRHMAEIHDRLNDGEDLADIRDEETGMAAVAHAACDLLFALWLVRGKLPKSYDLSGVREKFAEDRIRYEHGCDGPIAKTELPR